MVYDVLHGRTVSKVKVHSEISRAVRTRNPEFDMENVYAPDDQFVRVIKAGELIRRAQHTHVQPLAHRPLPPIPEETTLDGMFRTIVNQSLEAGLQPQGFASRTRRKSESTCLKSEVFLGTLLRAIEEGDLGKMGGGRLVIHDQEPLLLQKDLGQKTCLALREVTIAGITYPTGSIMGAHIARDKQQQTERYEPQCHFGHVEVVPSSEIDGINFLRPSLFALPPEERAQYLARPEWDYQRKVMTSDTLKIIAELSMPEVALIAEQSLSLQRT